LEAWSKSIPVNSEKLVTELNGPHCTELLNLNSDFEIQQHLESLKLVFNIIIWIRDMRCYSAAQEEHKEGFLAELAIF
jgi:hypothetical protein